MSREAQQSSDAQVSAIFFSCYRCSEPTMSLTPFGVYCQGCGLRSFTGSAEQRVQGSCGSGHSEMIEDAQGNARCLICSVVGGRN